jgi:hypothetical protein
MRLTALIGCVAVVAACSAKETPSADTTAAAPATSALANMAGTWNVNVMPMDRDTVVTSYVLNATDTAAMSFQFPGRTDVVQMRVTGTSGDTVMIEAGPFESALRPGQQVSTSSKNWIQGGQLMGVTTARYPGAADSVVSLRTVGTKQ